jgi:hypothetical protein
MDPYEVIQIRVGDYKIGIIGMRGIFQEMAEAYAEKPDEEVRAELLKRLSVKNYVSNPVLFGEAFLREFKKFLGKPVDEAPVQEIRIRILGPGCMQCTDLEKMVLGILSEMNLAADVEHVRDLEEIRKYRVLSMPGLVINDTLLCAGRVPPRDAIKSWLSRYIKP